MGFRTGAPIEIEHGKPWKRTLRMRGRVASYRDGLLVIERHFRPGGRYDSLGDPILAGDYGTVEVREGGWVLRRAYYRADGRLIGELFNIQTPVVFEPGLVRYTDLEIDVVRRPDGQVQVVDEDDLERAVAVGGIAPPLAAQARQVAQRLAAVLQAGGDWCTVSPAGPDPRGPGRAGSADARTRGL